MAPTRPTRCIVPNSSSYPRDQAAGSQQLASITETSEMFETSLGNRGSNAPGSAGDPLTRARVDFGKEWRRGRHAGLGFAWSRGRYLLGSPGAHPALPNVGNTPKVVEQGAGGRQPSSAEGVVLLPL